MNHAFQHCQRVESPQVISREPLQVFQDIANMVKLSSARYYPCSENEQFLQSGPLHRPTRAVDADTIPYRGHKSLDQLPFSRTYLPLPYDVAFEFLHILEAYSGGISCAVANLAIH